MNALSLKVKTLRISKGWTQTELANQARMSATAVHSLEDGGTPRPSTLLKLAKALGADPIEFAQLLMDSIGKES